MEIKKSEKANLESKKLIFRETGFIVVLLILLGAFEYTSHSSVVGDLTQGEAKKADEEMVEVTREEQVKPPEPPKPPEPEPPQDPEIKEVDNDQEDDSDKLKGQDDDQNKKIQEKIEFDEPEAANEVIFKRVEKMPEFPGGQGALMKFIGENVEFPQEAIDKEEEGTVVVRFVVNEEGKATKPEIVKNVSPLLDQAALNVVKKLPTFTPGEQAGKKVKVYYVVPIKFTLTR